VSALSHDQAASADDPFLAVQPSNVSLVPLPSLPAIVMRRENLFTNELQTTATATTAAAVPGLLDSDNPFYVNPNQQPFQQMQFVQALAQHLHHQPPFLAGSYSRTITPAPQHLLMTQEQNPQLSHRQRRENRSSSAVQAVAERRRVEQAARGIAAAQDAQRRRQPNIAQQVAQRREAEQEERNIIAAQLCYSLSLDKLQSPCTATGIYEKGWEG